MRIKNESLETMVSLDDIDILLIENQQTTITASLISHLAKKDIVVIFVDELFLPSATSLAFHKNSRTTKMQHAQVSLKKPRLKRLWKSIVYAKVLHQALLLKTYSDDKYLFTLLNKISSADKENIEALAASYYI